jgi:hypothetical protein
MNDSREAIDQSHDVYVTDAERSVMKFILVNGRIPFRRFVCAGCGEAISNSYLRDVTTQLYYCNHSCYSEHCRNAVTNLAHRTMAALVGLAPIRDRRSAGDDLTVST